MGLILAVAALETMVCVEQSSVDVHVELEEYDEDLEICGSEVEANGRQTTMEVMDAFATMIDNQKQSIMDANVNGEQS